ncbi:protein artemis-like [Thrips palmi]|uniref:Protein artemis n=1 Tax=Thrips palmi TaxID=161013 RepID=A0A6P8Z023_THRPL|nr:protein artemis-like [Thrips palmi]XP_034239890.1 protein artemis-like [Thrips palmi]XP_034239891.1 protein artemis-like [Thrips palmi]XP_034239892.1 protein artemis-like [Thrips palmi]
MSTFPGPIPEIPKISVDRFNWQNLKSDIFFLTHFHSDHMVGLRDYPFQNKLRTNSTAFLYCSELTALFLTQNHLKGFDDKIKVLPINSQQVISINEQHGCVTVTALPAGHCPGSVMFLFEYKGLNYLYTGDYRMTKENLMKMKPLKDSDGNFKPIETLYLDTTFFNPVYSYLPNRDESMRALIAQCRSWIEKGDDYIIDLRTPAIVGIEYVLIALSEEFAQPFHVCEKAYEKYYRIPRLSSAVTKSTNTKFHACLGGFNQQGKTLFIKHHAEFKKHKIFSVKLCTMHASNFSKKKNLLSYPPEEGGLHRLVYSSHSSYSELLEMIETLRPRKIEPCVVPKNFTPEQVVDALRPFNDNKVQRSDSDENSLLQMSSYEEDAPGCDSDAEEVVLKPKEEAKGQPLFTFSKYVAQDSSDEEDGLAVESEEDELPPFSWNYQSGTSKALSFPKHEEERLPAKRQKLNGS